MSKQLSKFVFKQLVYDYLTGYLDADETVRFEEKLNSDKDCFEYVELTKKSINFVSSISTVKVNNNELDVVANYKSDNLFYLYNLRSLKLTQNIISVSRVLAVALAFAFVIYMLPIKKIINKVSKPSFVQVKVADDIKMNEATDQLVNVFNTEYVTPLKNYFPQIGKISDYSLRVKLATNSELASNNTAEEKVKPQKTSGPQGYLYRAYMSLYDLETKTLEIIDVIENLGGEKAGVKELGYSKSKGKSFHFKLPLSNKEQVFKDLRAIGRVKVDEEKHWRKMPDGVSRVILWVEDLDLKAQRLQNR